MRPSSYIMLAVLAVLIVVQVIRQGPVALLYAAALVAVLFVLLTALTVFDRWWDERKS